MIFFTLIMGYFIRDDPNEKTKQVEITQGEYYFIILQTFESITDKSKFVVQNDII